MKTFIKYLLFQLILSSINVTYGQVGDLGKEGKFFKLENGIMYYDGEKFTGTTVKNHENGQLKRKASFINGELNGVCESYHENGELEGRSFFKDGKPEGVWMEYFENGQLKAKRPYKDGQTHGVVEYYLKNGLLHDKEFYINGKRVD
jgi:antitoxin component YwqK of YwqJK toxin-antitoxin module